jgi:hypothetical protein
MFALQMGGTQGGTLGGTLGGGLDANNNTE